MDIIKVGPLADCIPGSICPGGSEAQLVKVCGSRCVDNDAVAFALREAGVSVIQDGCHGTRGGCSNGELTDGTYATVPLQQEAGLVMREVIVQL